MMDIHVQVEICTAYDYSQYILHRDVYLQFSLIVTTDNIYFPGTLYRLHTAILDRPPSSAATMEVQGPDTQ